MSKRLTISLFGLILLAVCAAAQDTPTEPAPQPPVPAFGTDNPTLLPASENPPISGLDLPNLEPHGAPLSYLQAGAHFSESVDSNIQNSLGGSSLSTITRALGSLELQRLWSNYDLTLDYLGGVGYYQATGLGLKQIEELGVNQKVSWKRGYLGVRDAFSYQPEGTFGSSYGSIGATGAGLAGTSTFNGGSALGALGQVPRIMNLTLLDAVENLTPKSAITVTGGYGFVHFLGNELGTNAAFIGNSQISAEIGYDRVLGPHDQGALVYGYQGFQFSTGVDFHSHVIQAMWGHRISGRMDFVVSAGPQFTQINNLLTTVNNPTAADTTPPCVLQFTATSASLECPENDLRISAAGRALFRYRFPKASLEVTYDHYLTSGSGFFAGAESDIARVSVSRPLNRIWSVYSDIGYSRNSRVSSLTATQLAGCSPSLTNQNPPPCPGTSANVYQYGFAGAGIHRMFGHTFHAFASYQFNDLTFDSSYCSATVGTTAGPCNRTSQRSVGTVGLDWTPRPMRID
jgi:hypothetical protein